MRQAGQRTGCGQRCAGWLTPCRKAVRCAARRDDASDHDLEAGFSGRGSTACESTPFVFAQGAHELDISDGSLDAIGAQSYVLGASGISSMSRNAVIAELAEASTSGEGGEEGTAQQQKQAPLPKVQKGKIRSTDVTAQDEGLGAALSGVSGKVRDSYNKVKDLLFFKEPLPPIGAARISYAKFLSLLNARQIKRMTIMADGKVALVEIPIHQGGHDYDTQRYNDDDLTELYVRELPEWQMEMLRFYVDLPGDFWYNSDFHSLIKASLPHRTGDGFVNFKWVTLDSQYTVEARVLPPGEGYQWAAAYSNQILLVVGLVAFRTAVGGLEWVLTRLGKLRGPKVSEKAKMYMEMSKSIAKQYNVGGGPSGTGVQFADVQGIDHVKDDILEILKMLLGSDEYDRMGAKTPQGVLLEGPPGTGKTFLAKAMANEAGLPFFSANGAEFVQMFQGVAASRVGNLFKDARENSPSIVFIDEIDALGKARNPDGLQDPGSKEREQGLLQLLVEMDGFKTSDRVLVIGATNRRDVLDPALLRPGRFDRIIYMGTPTPENRYKILAVHARGKQIPRENDDALLRQVADMAVGYSGAELANILNEAAILQVRYAKAEIDMEIMQEVMDKARVGLPGVSVPLSKAKRHLAIQWAGRATITAALGIPSALEAVSLRSVGSSLGRLLYSPYSTGYKRRTQVGDFAYCVELMVPLYAARATEEVVLGPERATLSTAGEIAMAAQFARWLCVQSGLNPATRGLKVTVDPYNPVSQYLDNRQFEEMALRIQTLAYHRALVLAHQRKDMIETVADELLSRSDATVTGYRLEELLAQPEQEVSEEVMSSLPFKELLPDTAAPTFMVDEKKLARAVGLVKGDIDPGMFYDTEDLETIAKVFGDESKGWFEKRKQTDAFASDADARFPPKPDLAEKTVAV